MNAAGSPSQVVTGAFGYIGRRIAERLLARGERVRTLTNHPRSPDPFGGRVEVKPYDFRDSGKLRESLAGASVLYNTYWVRFEHGGKTFAQAVANSRALFAAARDAGIRRIVHVSIMNSALDSPLPYYRGKAEVEEALRSSGLSFAIVRPSVVFGEGDILINNIAYLLRHWPVFGIPGRGDYRLQPVFVDDLADMAVNCGAQTQNVASDAAGTDVFTFNELAALLATTVQSQARIVHLPPSLALFAARIIGLTVGDVVLTREEIDGLLAGLLASKEPPSAPTSLRKWLAANAAVVGTKYASEVARHFR